MTIKKRFTLAEDTTPCAHCGKDVPVKHINLKNFYGATESVCDYKCLQERRRTMMEEMR